MSVVYSLGRHTSALDFFYGSCTRDYYFFFKIPPFQKLNHYLSIFLYTTKRQWLLCSCLITCVKLTLFWECQHSQKNTARYCVSSIMTSSMFLLTVSIRSSVFCSTSHCNTSSSASRSPTGRRTHNHGL